MRTRENGYLQIAEVSQSPQSWEYLKLLAHQTWLSLSHMKTQRWSQALSGQRGHSWKTRVLEQQNENWNNKRKPRCLWWTPQLRLKASMIHYLKMQICAVTYTLLAWVSLMKEQDQRMFHSSTSHITRQAQWLNVSEHMMSQRVQPQIVIPFTKPITKSKQ